MITTQLIGLKQFRANISTLWKKSQKKNIRYIVMNHARPILEVRPVQDADILMKLANDIAHSRKQVEEGKVYTQKELRQILDL
ncbi:MAG: hypothetical protein HYV32_03725 [Candidatus Kerfeldbacteria bacterium]|nr:hypothetical protein [Candidatus Kerfeldbacteria bacterium]